MAAVYILWSKKADGFYIGATKDLPTRVEYHKSKEFKSSFTAKYEDWEFFFFIDNLEITTARKIENHIKKMKSRAYLENLKKYPEMPQKLVKKFS